MLKNIPEYLNMSSEDFSEELCKLNKGELFELCKRLRFNLNDSHEIAKLWKDKSNKLEVKLDALKQAFNDILEYTGEEN